MKEDRGYYQLKKEIGEVKDLVQELMRHKEFCTMSDTKIIKINKI